MQGSAGNPHSQTDTSPIQYLLQYQLEVSFPLIEVIQILYKDLLVILTPIHMSPVQNLLQYQLKVCFPVTEVIQILYKVIQILYKALLVILTPIHILSVSLSQRWSRHCTRICWESSLPYTYISSTVLTSYQLKVCFPATEVIQILYKVIQILYKALLVSSLPYTFCLFPCHRGDPDTVQGYSGNPHSHTHTSPVQYLLHINSKSVSLSQRWSSYRTRICW